MRGDSIATLYSKTQIGPAHWSIRGFPSFTRGIPSVAGGIPHLARPVTIAYFSINAKIG